ncbi:MAG: VapC toxin family PIN domain ribonuclease [Chloroflexi bacterium]|nr:MAG: VapC toxin family PIN domain ribonuclease [Chloroflexota bacterium]
MKDTHFLDTNIFLRYLTGDDDQKYEACLTLFQQAERNEISLVTSEGVIAEVVHVLSSPKHYQLSRSRIQIALSRLLILSGLKVPQRQVCLRALDLYTKHNLDFEDCLSLAHMEQQNLTQLYSYDQGFDAIAGVSRLEPSAAEANVVESRHQEPA